MMWRLVGMGSAFVCACFALLGEVQAQDLDALYRAHIDAFNRRDAKVFFARYAPSLCFHNDAVTPADLEKTYAKHFGGSGDLIEVKYVHVLSAGEAEARLWAVFMHGKRPVTRVLALQKGPSGWVIAAETNPTRLKCATDILKGLPDDMSAIITATAKQIQHLGEVLDGKKQVDDLTWEDLYCPKGYKVDVDGWGDHDFDGDGDLVEGTYCRVGDADCRSTADGEVLASGSLKPHMSAYFRPECDSGAGMTQDGSFSLTLNGHEVFTVAVERPYP